MQSLNQDVALPALRPDIEIFAGPLEEDGSPTYVIHDPVSGIFNKIGWSEAVVLQRLRQGQTLFSLLRELEKQTTLNSNPEEVVSLCEDAESQGLTISSQVRPAQQLFENATHKKVGPLKWLVYHYLYFRIPILHPDKFLDRTLPRVKVLFSKQAKFIYLLFACIGLYFLSQRFGNYVSTFLYFFNFKGVIAYSIVIIILKTAHEFGHAYVAKHYGVRVPTMGLAFMVFVPVAYSDVTDSWRLRSRKKRLAITLAGVKVELVIGAIAMALWGLTPPGILNSICFLLSSTTLLSTFLVNLNPAMRFDGYYILSDLWGIDNLSSQTTQFTKWFLRRNLLGLDLPCPISKPKPRKQLKIILYSIYAWNYRFFLYLGIAILVYYKFTKTLGLILFILEIMIFIVRPITEEVKVLMKMRGRIKFNYKLCLTLSGVFLAAGWAILPIPRIKKAPAVFLPVQSQIVYAPREGQIKETMVERGQMIKKGAVLAHLESESLNTEIEHFLISRKQLQHDIERLNMDEEVRAMVPEMERQLASIEEKLAGLIEQRNQLIIKAQISGKLVEWDPMLTPGCYIKKHQSLGRIAATDNVRIDAFVSEKEVKHLDIGQDVKFFPADHSDYVHGIVEQVDPIREESVNLLDIGAAASKELPLVNDSSSSKLTLLGSYYRVSIAVNEKYRKNVRLGQSGNVRYLTHKRSFAWELLLYVYSVLIRESSF